MVQPSTMPSTSLSLGQADGFERLSPEFGDEDVVGVGGPSLWHRLRWIGPVATVVGAAGLVAVLARGGGNTSLRESTSARGVVQLQSAATFTCAMYGCLDVVATPYNPCGCSPKCVEMGDCCADYQATCAGVTPGNNPLLDRWLGCNGAPAAPDPGMAVWHYAGSGAPLQTRVMCYNAEWWHVVEQMGGNGNSNAKTIMDADMTMPIDIIGMQEFYDPWYGFTRPGFDATSLVMDFQWLRGEVGGPVGQLIGYRKSVWSLLNRGQHFVAEDLKGPMYYGNRNIFWVRLYHLQTGTTVYVANHHGPLAVNSGGVCGGATTAANILNAVAQSAEAGDAIILLGDFNADGSSETHREISRYLKSPFHGIDNIFTNLPEGALTAPMQVGGGGSDHNAITAVLDLGATR